MRKALATNVHSVSALAANLKSKSAAGAKTPDRIHRSRASVASAAVESIIAPTIVFSFSQPEPRPGADSGPWRIIKKHCRASSSRPRTRTAGGFGATSADFPMAVRRQVRRSIHHGPPLIDRREDPRTILIRRAKNSALTSTVLRLGKAYMNRADRVDQYLSQYVAFHPITEDDSHDPQTPSANRRGRR